MNDVTKIQAILPCYNMCIVKGTEKQDVPSLMPAVHGNFCAREYRSAVAALKLSGTVVEHVLSMVDSKASQTDRVDSSRQAPLPLNEQAFNDANNIYQRLVYWARHFAKLMGVQAPGPAVRAWRDMNGTIIGLPIDITPTGARYTVGVMAKWLDIHLESICNLPQVDDVEYFLTGAGQIREVFTINARWPQEAKPYYSKLPCPDDKGRIAVYPPNEFGDDTMYKCEKCGRIFDEERHEFYSHLFAKVSIDEIVTSERAKRHLLRKFAS